MAVVLRRTIAKGCESPYFKSSPPRMPLEVFPRLPFGTPQRRFRHLSIRSNGPQYLRAVVYFSGE